MDHRGQKLARGPSVDQETLWLLVRIEAGDQLVRDLGRAEKVI